jgi:hypothetical protein
MGADKFHEVFFVKLYRMFFELDKDMTNQLSLRQALDAHARSPPERLLEFQPPPKNFCFFRADRMILLTPL